jgi:hypothetical protein
MNSLTSWLHRPFMPLDRRRDATLPYIGRLSTDTGSITIQWCDHGSDGPHTLICQKVDADVPDVALPVSDASITVEGLSDLTDYNVTLARDDGTGAVTRRVRTGHIPGNTVVNYLHPQDPAFSFSGRFLGTPTLARCPSGRLVAAMDVFWRHEYYAMLSPLFCSDDGGSSWRWLGELAPSYWPKLFVHRGVLYGLSATQGGGCLVIARSEDEGETWSAPVLLFATNSWYSVEGNCGNITEKNGRLYIPIACGSWNTATFRMSYISAPADSDLLDPAQWTIADLLEYDPAWPGSPAEVGPGCGSPGAGIEGNIIEGPDGTLHACYRMDIEAAGKPNYGKMLLLDIDTTNPEAPYRFNAIVECTLGSNAKFCLNYDPVSRYYVLLGNEQIPGVCPKRTVLSMAVSEDLHNWRVVHRIFDFRNHDPKACGFQYPDWVFDGDDIVTLTRVGYNMADTHHNSNCITFTRIRNFRQYF